MYNNPNINIIRRVIFIAIIALILLAGWVIYFILSTKDTIVVSLEKAPFDTTVYLEGVKIESASIRLKPGEYTFDVSREGFHSKQVTATIDTQGNDVAVLFLSPESDEAKRLVTENEAYHYDHTASAGEIYDPILDYLPISNVLYSVRSNATDEVYPDMPVQLTISAAKGYRNAALQAVQDKNVDLSMYTYDFINYKDPF